ncbi:MAG TPA: response regulator [Thermoanaerobaculia bacterium]|nr:response regulator [Thermoanaerobaculia bacterium]
MPVLIVDDDEPTQSLLRAVLRRCGHTSEIARDGREAIEKLQAKQYVAVVLDMMMPEVNGRDVIAFLSEMETPVPVIICSAAGPAALAGFDPRVVKAIVRKPFDVDEFLVTVTSVTGSSAS